MWNKVFIYLLVLFLIPAISFSQEKFTFLELNQVAPFEGVLYSPEANAKILTLIETSTKSYQLKLKQQNEQLSLKFEKKIDKMEIEYKLKLELKEQENNLLTKELFENRKLLADPPIQWSNIIIGSSIGVVVGFILSLIFIKKL